MKSLIIDLVEIVDLGIEVSRLAAANIAYKVTDRLFCAAYILWTGKMPIALDRF